MGTSMIDVLPYLLGARAVVALFAISALVNAALAKKAERDNPPTGSFVEVDGIRIHYVERGKGEPLVLLHGNGSMIQDFECSGLISLASKQFRVIAFDRPGFGHTPRPRGRVWTPDAQAELIATALRKIGVSRAVVLGHSWGASAAVALALKYPQLVGAVVLASGYYYPTLRLDVLPLSVPAVPVIGDFIRYSISPIISRLMWPLLVRKIFAPEDVPAKFAMFPKEMAFRPSQIRAAAAESGMMIPSAYTARTQYRKMEMPIVIVAGEGDQLVDTERQSARLHTELPHSVMHRIAGTGHMVHQTAPEKVMDAINEAARADRKTANTSAGNLRSARPANPTVARRARAKQIARRAILFCLRSLYAAAKALSAVRLYLIFPHRSATRRA
jgi:pimeloyl-ACP methyl ester carboxylesterase